MDQNNSQQVPMPIPQSVSLIPQPQGNSFSFFKILAIGFAVVFFCIAIGVVGYMLGARKNNQYPQLIQQKRTTPISIPIVDPTANWKTYISTDDAYSFKYPDIKYIQKSHIESSLPANEGSRHSVYVYYCPLKDKSKCNSDDSFILIDSYENVNNWDLDLWYKTSAYSPGVTLKDSCIEKDPATKISKVTFLSKPAYIYEFRVSGQIVKKGCLHSSINFEKSGYYKYIILNNGQNILFLQEFSHISSLKSQLDQILSTFKFINQNQPVTPTKPVSGLVPADSQYPAAGACSGPSTNQTIVIIFGMDNVPQSRCVKVTVI